MSELSYMEKLLDGVEVEWKALGTLTKVLRGKRLVKSQLSNNEKSPVYHGGLEPLGYYKSSNRPANTVMIINVGASAGTVGYSATDFWSSDGCFCIEHTTLLNNRYLYYVLIGYQHLLRSKVRRAGIPTLDAIIIEKLQIPIPPLKIQAEIVRILDALTELTAELTAELVARKQQYAYYRDQLLTFEEGRFDWKTLDEVADFSNGKGHEKDISTNGRYTVVNSKFISTDGNVAKYSDKQICPLFSNDILIVMSDLPNGKALAKTFFVEDDGKYTLNQRIGGITVKDETILFSKFLYYFLNRTPQLLKHNDGASQTNLRKGQILEVKIPIPPLAEQERIVAILDKFDVLTTSLTEGLPREIALRQQQYEYYRELLLSFPKAEVADHD